MTVFYGSGLAGTFITEFYADSPVPFNYTFPANYQGQITLRADTWFLFEGNPYGGETTFLTVNVRVPSPGIPNGGLITACQAGEQISLSSLPVLNNNQDDCFFHCGVQWQAPAGWTLQDGGFSPGNPIFGTFTGTKLIPPSGAFNGLAGQVSVTALYSQCGQSFNTSSTANIWYGPPAIQSTYPSQSFTDVPNGQINLSVQAISATSYTWQIEGGSGYIYPSGNSCGVSTSGFVRVVAYVSNRCGQGSSYTFYIRNSSSGGYGYRVGPNPATSNLAFQFDEPEMMDAVKSISLLDEKGKVVRNFDGVKAKKDNALQAKKAVEWTVADLPKGRYFLHVNYGDVVDKSQIALN